MLILRMLFEKTSAIADSRGKKQPNKLSYSESIAFVPNKPVDKRLEHLPFTSPYSIFALVAVYLLFVLKWGPKFMEHRKPFNIERILIIYNLLQVVLNFTLVAFVSVCSLVLPMQIPQSCWSISGRPSSGSVQQRVQHLLPAAGLHQLARWHALSLPIVRVFTAENSRLVRHGLLRSAEADAPDLVPARLPPRGHPDGLVGRHFVGSR